MYIYTDTLEQLVVLPYQTLLHRDTRKASNIDLKGHVVIIDEAHNLLDTINTIHSVQISGRQVTYSGETMLCYLNKHIMIINNRKVY